MSLSGLGLGGGRGRAAVDRHKGLCGFVSNKSIMSLCGQGLVARQWGGCGHVAVDRHKRPLLLCFFDNVCKTDQ